MRAAAPANIRADRIRPYVGAIAAESPELDVVAMARLAALEDEDELMLGPIERAHAAVGLDPDTEVQQLRIGSAPGFEHLRGMAPIHALEVNRAGPAVLGAVSEDAGQEPRKVGRRHLA